MTQTIQTIFLYFIAPIIVLAIQIWMFGDILWDELSKDVKTEGWIKGILLNIPVILFMQLCAAIMAVFLIGWLVGVAQGASLAIAGLLGFAVSQIVCRSLERWRPELYEKFYDVDAVNFLFPLVWIASTYLVWRILK